MLSESTPNSDARDELAEVIRAELGWDWNRNLGEHIPSALDCVRPVADAVIAAGYRPQASTSDADELLEQVAEFGLEHLDQGRVIAGIESLTAQLAERDAVIARVREARSDHPQCDKHDEGDAVSCGWRRAVQDIDAALEYREEQS